MSESLWIFAECSYQSDCGNRYYAHKERTTRQANGFQRTAVCGITVILLVFKSEEILGLEAHYKMTVFMDTKGRECSVTEVNSWIIIGMEF